MKLNSGTTLEKWKKLSTLNIQVIDVQEDKGTTRNGKPYNLLNVTYKNQEGKVDSKKVMEWDRDVFPRLQNAQKGDVFSIAREKNEKGYWDWKEASRQDGAMEIKPASTQPATRPQYESAEERAQRQIWIVRQSTLAQAVAYCQGSEFNTVETVLEIAKQFEEHIFRDSGSEVL